MGLEALLAASAIAIATLAAVARLGRGRALGITILVTGVASAGLTALGHRRPPGDPEVTNRPIEVEGDGYVSSETCKTCHPHQYATWYGSYHRTMTQVATPASVVGRFDTVIRFGGQVYRLERRGDRFWVAIDAPGWSGAGEPPRMEAPIVMTTGSHHQQAYWYATGRNRLVNALPFAYLVDQQRWVPRVSVFLAPPVQRWDVGPRWNTLCIRCHATHGQPRETEPDAYDTRVGEFGIACEACHGPAERHVRDNRAPWRRYRYHLSGDPDSTVVRPDRPATHLSAQVCGQCHGVHYFYTAGDIRDWNENGFPYRPGDDLAETRLIVRHTPSLNDSEMTEILRVFPQYKKEDRFWSDGMIRVSGREYNGLIESPCYQGGRFSCLSCHEMHKPPEDPRPLDEWANDQLGRGMEGDEACLQCHESYRADIVKHTFHPERSSGSRCYNCHMSYTTYGLLKAIRSHQVDSPSVAASLATGRPNACNQCHLDRTLAWTSEHLEEWYGRPGVDLGAEERSIAASVLWTARGDAGQRALMAWSMGWDAAREASGSDWMAPYLAQLLTDPYDAVRIIAERSLRTLPGFGDLDYDFLAAPAERQEMSQRILQTWNGSSAGIEGKRAERVLVEPGRGLRGDALSRLLQQRDQRPVFLKE